MRTLDGDVVGARARVLGDLGDAGTRSAWTAAIDPSHVLAMEVEDLEATSVRQGELLPLVAGEGGLR